MTITRFEFMNLDQSPIAFSKYLLPNSEENLNIGQKRLTCRGEFALTLKVSEAFYGRSIATSQADTSQTICRPWGWNNVFSIRGEEFGNEEEGNTQEIPLAFTIYQKVEALVQGSDRNLGVLVHLDERPYSFKERHLSFTYTVYTYLDQN